MRGFVNDRSAPGGVRLADDLPEPEPAPDELVAEVRAYGVNRGELISLERNRDGWRPGQDLGAVVLTPAADGSGPPAGTRIAAAVYSRGWSERVAVKTERAVPLPDAVSFEQAASLHVAGLTALRALRVGGPVVGRRVLVTGATGGVGQFAVQLAVLGGAEVTALVSGPEREPEARGLGASRVVSSLEDDSLGLFDLVLEGVGGPVLTQAVHRLAPGGTVAAYGVVAGPSELSLFDFRSAPGPLGKVVGFFYHYPEETLGEDLATLVGFVADGRLDPLLGSVSGWERTPEVLDELRERRVRGKAILTLG